MNKETRNGVKGEKKVICRLQGLERIKTIFKFIPEVQMEIKSLYTRHFFEKIR